MRQVAVAAVLCAAFSSSVYAQSSYSSVYVFGDSYSDRGRIPGIVLKQYPDWPSSWISQDNGGIPLGGVTTPPPASPYFKGRFSNGPTWAERLPKLIRVRPNSAKNYAVGGATIAPFLSGGFTTSVTKSDNLESVFLEDVFTKDPTTVPKCRDSGTCIDLPGIQTQIDCFLGDCPTFAPPGVDLPGFAAGRRFKASDVVTLFGGGNDYFAFIDRAELVFLILPSPTLREVPKEVNYVTNAVSSSIRKLVKAGAKTLLVPNMPNIGSLPAYNGTQCTGTAATNFVCTPEQRKALQLKAKIGTALSVQHNAALNAKLGKLAKNLGVNIFVVDFATAVDTVRANPARFGFTNTDDACVQKRKKPPSGWTVGTTGVIPPASLVPGQVCGNPNEHLFWDQFHPTSAAHQILAEYAADTLLAPETIGAQADLALTNGDSFLRRMQEAILGTGGSVRGQQPKPSGSKSLSEIMPDRGSVFVNVRGADVDGSPATNAFGFDSQVTQVSGGVVVRPWDNATWENVTLGLIGGIDNGTADLDQYRSSIDLTSYHLGLMAGYDNGALFAGGGVSFSHEDYDLYRQTFVPQLQSAADTGGNPFGAFGSAGYRFNMGRITAGPLVALRYTEAEIDQYSETGAPGLDMIVQSQRAEQLIGSAGIAAAVELAVLSTTVVPYVHLALEGDLMNDDRNIRTALVTVPDVGRTHVIESYDDVYGRLDGGISFAMAPGLIRGITGTLSGETTFSRDAGDEQAIMGTISGRF